MNIHKTALLSLMFAMPFAVNAKLPFEEIKEIFSDKQTRDIMKEGAKDIATIMVIQRAVVLGVTAPVQGLLNGCKRRTMTDMEARLKTELSPEEFVAFTKNHIDEKIDTKIATTATGPLSAIGLGGIYVGMWMLKPAGFVLAGLAVAGNVGALLWTEKAQAHNDSSYTSAIKFINDQRKFTNKDQVVGFKGLSSFQKMFCNVKSL